MYAHLLFLPTTKHTSDIAPSTFGTVGHSSASRLCAPSQPLACTLGILGNGVCVVGGGSPVGARLILATSFGAVDALFGGHVPDWSEEPLFPNLITDEVVDAVLEIVDLGDTGDFGFV